MQRKMKIGWALAVIGMLYAGSGHTDQHNGYGNGHDAGQLAISAGLTYGFDVEEPGIRAGATYYLNDAMRVGGDFTYWLVGDENFLGEKLSLTYWEANANFNYIFHQQDAITVYAIGSAGLHRASVSMTITGLGSFDDSDTKVGLGGGVGAEYSLGQLSIFAEPKLFLSGFDQLKFNMGIRYYL